MQLRDFLSTEAFTPVNKAIARKIWFTCAWFLWELIRQRDHFWQWEFYYSQSDMEEEIWLSAKVQRSCISILVKLGWITVEKKGTPCRNYYVINDWQILFDYNIETKYGGETWCDQMSQLDVTKGNDLIWQKVTTYNKKENNKKENKNYTRQNEVLTEKEKKFEEFWSLYPKKKQKKNSLKVFNRIDSKEYDNLMNGLMAQVDYWRRKGQDKQYIPDPNVWLNGERWNDEIEDGKMQKKVVYNSMPDVSKMSMDELKAFTWLK